MKEKGKRWTREGTRREKEGLEERRKKVSYRARRGGETTTDLLFGTQALEELN